MHPQDMHRVPPLTANVNMACFNCFKEEKDKVSLQRCSRCRRVSYCGAICQRENWAMHKAFCKGFNALESGEADQRLPFSSTDQGSSDVDELNSIVERQARDEVRQLQFQLGRPIDLIERNLVGLEPRCMACTRTDKDIRTQSSPMKPSIYRTLKACSDCGLCFFCSDEHLKVAQPVHSAPSEDGHSGLSQCQINQEIRADIRFENIHATAGGMGRPTSEGFKWAPSRIVDTWTSLSGRTWLTEFESDIVNDLRLPSTEVAGPFLRSASDALSMPMTILWGLEMLNTDDAWTRKDVLTIHVLGAFEKELMHGNVFEVILHRLPEVKTLHVVMCGPELAQHMEPDELDNGINMDTCPTCHRRSRTRIHEHRAETYHAFIHKLGNRFTPPDLAIAFNSGSSQEAVRSWQETTKILVKQGIPTVFTAYNRQEANDEAKLLRAAGASLVSTLGPGKNPWGSMLNKKEPNKMVGFYAVNGYLAGGFR